MGKKPQPLMDATRLSRRKFLKIGAATGASPSSLEGAASGLPGPPLHSLMARMDKLFGFGNTHDIRANTDFWK